MTAHNLLRYAACFAMFSLLILPPTYSLESTASKPSQDAVALPYPNNAEGLRQFLKEMLLDARNGAFAALQAKIRDTEIPNYREWFTTTFNGGRGESWAGPYGERLDKHEKEFQDFMLQLARRDGEIIVKKLDAAKMYDPITVPLDLYLADWKRNDSAKGQEVDHIGYFWFLAGRFRWDSNTEFVRDKKPQDGTIVPGKVIKQVPPEYPKEARQKGIQGTVRLAVIIKKDGSVTVLNVVDGDPILSPAAIHAVRQWRYTPTIFKGEPVEVNTTISVTFSLNR